MRFHEAFLAEYGANHLLIRKIFQAAHKAEVACTDSDIAMKLITWSKKIQEDFMNRNIDLHTNTNNERLLAQLVEEMSKQNHLTTQVMQQNATVIKNQEELKSRLLNAEVLFQTRSDALQQQLMSLAGRISSIQQPSQLSSSPLSGQK